MKFSVITVCYNSGHTIVDTINSVASQTHRNKEHLIIDGGSTDKTLDVVNKHISNISYFVSEPDHGLYDAMNKGLKKATGDIISIINADDFLRDPNVFDEIALVFKENPEIDVVFGGVELVHPSNLKLPLRSYRLNYFRPWMVKLGIIPPHPAVFIRKRVYDRIGVYKQKYSIAADFDLLTRLLVLEKVNYRMVDSTFVTMRTGGLSNSGLSSLAMGTRQILDSLRENGIYSNYLLVLLRMPYKYITQSLRISRVFK